MDKPRLAYVSFDIVPAPKGAATHITAVVKSLAAAFGKIELVTVAPTTEFNQGLSTTLDLPGVIHSTLPAIGDTVINRAMHFRRHLSAWWKNQRFEVVQIRSIYEGFPIALNKQQYCNQLIFEVNGLPSIELKYHYPEVAEDRELMHKLRTQEELCLEAADLIITPSRVTSGYLQTRGVPNQKIRVLPNGVDLDIFTYRSPQLVTTTTPLKVLYFGTLSPWQGVGLAVEALAVVGDLIYLTVIGPGRDRQVQALNQLALKLGVANQLKVLEPMSQTQLVEQIHAADVIVAPLMPSDRNLYQGCCPLKILEGMATGTPVITSNIPVVRELGMDGVHLLAVKPGSAQAIAEALVRLRTEPGLATQLAQAARNRVETHHTWKLAGDALVAIYEEIGIKRSITV